MTVLLGGALFTCTKDRPSPLEPAPPPAAVGAAQLTSAAKGEVHEPVEVPSDKPVVVSFGKKGDTRPIVYLHGMCAAPHEDLEAWGNLSEVHGTIIALVGDVPCDGQSSTKWSDDASKLDRRITTAIDAVNATGRVKLDVNDVVLIGESMGASRAESLAGKFPDRYARLVLVGAPSVASPVNLSRAKAIAHLAGSKESQQKPKESARALENAGKDSRFWELPGATHGSYGPEGERVMKEALDFVTQ